MPVGKSGRIVIEIDPELKQELYQSLGKDESNLKGWFLEQVNGYLSGKSQMPIQFPSKSSHDLSEVSS
tara:strand:+ start:325 stop:528 length:204 start_codon:yes stop_codon:yes gene_type:complete